ncbi:hypothetical protein ACJRO7_010346 [Eucalyptus globulus]|uniref:Uncharacterized protein n=1 Tax=Eucalyptus globulus TaxID=34317 RepID=A0ABD3LCH5_EUCGL
MADVVIGSIAGKIVAILGSQATETVGKLWGLEHELKALKNTVSTLRAVLHHAEEQYYQSSQVKDWVEKLKDALYDAEDVLEEFNIEALQPKLRGHKKMTKEVKTFFSSSNQLAFKLKMGYKVRAVRESIEAIKADKGFYLEERPVNSEAERERRKRRDTHSFVPEGYIIGRDADKETVKGFLMDSNMKEPISILPIVGIGGLGKTALAQSVYNDEMVGNWFELKMWVCVSDDFDWIKIVKNIIVCGKNERPIEDTMEPLQRKLREKIDGKRYLLVLDDLWNIEQETWLSLKTLLGGGARGSKILITTRLLRVVKIIGTTSPYCLKDLSESASVDLLMQMACREEDERQDSEMLAIATEIVRKCSGVPLVIRTIGGLLLFKESKHEWSQFKDNELPDVFQRKDHIKSVLKLSYDHLPSHLKQCFAFCSLFPKDYEMKKQTLIGLWMAEGFIQPSNGGQHLEDIAHGYFMDLLWSNFFQDLKKEPFSNEETCKMHDLMHDLACLVAGNEYSVASDDTKSIHERTRHISYGSTFNLMGKLSILCLKASALRTFLSTANSYHEEREPASEDLCQLIQNFKRLRILDLHSTKLKKVPRSIYKLKHLTYLDLSNNRTLKRLPNSITRLQNLQTLNLDDCDALEELPSDIRKLVNLRNLSINYCWKLSYMPHGLGELSSLQRLSYFILPKDRARAKNYCRLGELKGLNNIRGELLIENLKYVTNAEVECRDANLMGKHSLESLLLNWSDINTDDTVIANRDEALWDGLRPPSNLQKLTIARYEGENFPRWMMDDLIYSLPHLVKVSLTHCERCKRLPPLGQLPHLKSLFICQLTEFEDIKWDQLSPSTASFPSLSVLNIYFWEKLKAISLTPSDQFPNLSILKIYGCEKLEAIPLTPHLEDLCLIKANGALLINRMMLGLNKLKRLNIQDTKFPECLPEEGFQSLTSLESVEMEKCHQLTSLSQGMRHLSSLVDLSILDCEELDISKDESGNILDFHGGLPSLWSLRISCLPKLESLPQWILQLRNLECLKISDCPNFKALSEQIEKCEELDISKDENGNILDFHGGLLSFRSVEIYKLPKLTSLPQWLLQARNLERLEIWECPNLKDIPEQIEALQSLQNLDIIGCNSLTSFPEAMRRLTSLTYLRIYNCGELEESCKRQAGEDWDKIAHIPNILIKPYFYSLKVCGDLVSQIFT